MWIHGTWSLKAFSFCFFNTGVNTCARGKQSCTRAIMGRKQPGVLLLLLDGMLVHHRVPKHEVTRSITTPTEWDASPSQGTQT